MTKYMEILHKSNSLGSVDVLNGTVNHHPYYLLFKQALKMHNPENWIIYKPFKQAVIVQRLIKLLENFKDHCNHH